MGHTITQEGDMEQDANVKRAQFLQRAAEIKSFFCMQHQWRFSKLLKFIVLHFMVQIFGIWGVKGQIKFLGSGIL